MSENILFGTDPEYGIFYKKDNKDFVLPAAFFRLFGHIPCVKEDIKHPVMFEIPNYKIIEDGVAFEFTVKPENNMLSLVNNVRFLRKNLEQLIPKQVEEFGELGVSDKPVLNFDVERWANESSKFKMSMIFGCDKDFDARELDYNCETRNALRHPFRYFGGHIHVSLPENNSIFKDIPKIGIRVFSVLVGTTTTLFSKYPELEKIRVGEYGRPQRFRPQKYSSGIYGIEYRTPSTNWTTLGDEFILVIEKAIRTAVDYLINDSFFELLNHYEDRACTSIVEVNKTECEKILKELNVL